MAEQAAPYLTGPDQGSWLARLDTEQANLRRAAQYAAGRPDGTALVLRLGVALGRYWGARSQQQEAFRLLVPVLRRSDARANPALLGPALVTAAAVACFIDGATARQLAEQAVQVARQLGDLDGCSAEPWRQCAARISSPASRRQGARSGRSLLSGPGGSATTCCWAGACSCIS